MLAVAHSTHWFCFNGCIRLVLAYISIKQLYNIIDLERGKKQKIHREVGR